MTDYSDNIEDALVAWWHARTMLEATEGRLTPGTDSVEHARARRTEASARNVLFGTVETYLRLVSRMPDRLRPIDAYQLLVQAGQVSEDVQQPPSPPARGSEP